jgi:hypothetical protein
MPGPPGILQDLAGNRNRMQLAEMIRELRREKQQLEQIIALFEDLQTIRAVPNSRGSRGRRFMNTQERRKASKRMKEYWATRRRKVRSLPKAGRR